MVPKKHKLMRCLLVGTIVLGLTLFVLYWFGELALLREAPYEVEIPDSTQVQGKLYSLSGQRYLLVLCMPGTSTHRGFIVDLPGKEMGMPSFPRYNRFGRFALVGRRTLEGYCLFCGGLTADFEAHGDRSIIRVTGLVEDPNCHDPHSRSFLEEALIYSTRIVLREKR
jgi:hypothetical protein